MPANPSYLENAFELWVRQSGLASGGQKEYRFALRRNWRFDFAWPIQKVAVEIDGLRYDGKAGHQTVKGVLADAEKYEAALLLGWRSTACPVHGSRKPRAMTCGLSGG